MNALRAVNGRAVFLDKDGTLVRNVAYNVDPDKIVFLPRVSEGLRYLAAAGYRLIVISNQPGVARGVFAEPALSAVHGRLRRLFASAGAALDGFFYCPHDPQGAVEAYRVACRCRKPQNGLLARAAEELELDLHHSWMIGDILDDVEAGRRSGCRTILIDNGNETEWRRGPWRLPHFIARNFLQAARAVTGEQSISFQKEWMPSMPQAASLR